MKNYFLLILAAILMLLISCNSEGIGIFYKISVEPPLSNSAISEKSVYKIVNDGTLTYVLAGGTIYQQSGTDWAPMSVPSGEIQAVSLATIGTDVYSVYADNANSTMYELNGTGWIQAPGTSSIVNSNDLMLVEIDGDASFILVCEEVSQQVFNIFSYDNTTLIDITGIDTITMPIVSASFGAVDYYFVSSNITNQTSAVIFTSSDITLSTAITKTVPATGISAGIGSILYYATDFDLYASGKDGKLYISDESGGSGALAWTAVNTTALGNTSLGPLAIVNIDTNDYMLIGSNGGFYEMDISTGLPVSPTAVTIGSTIYESVNLYTEVVHSILSTSSDTFFIGSSSGLWYSDTSSLTLK